MEPVFYLDSSAIVKRYCEEKGSKFVDTFYEYERNRDTRFYSSRHTLAEVDSSIQRRFHQNLLNREEASATIKAFLQESLSSINFIDIDNILLYRAIALMGKYKLRSGDSIQLSAAMEVYFIHGNNLHFISSDHHLNETARCEGINVIDPAGNGAVRYLLSI